MLSILLLVALPGASGADHWSGDAPLSCVRFVDQREGWAAGADGVLWHSIDAGTTWERQPLPTRAHIHSLHFLTAYTGYAAGREEMQGGGSVGVVLKTTDGGLSWTRIGAGLLPGIQSITFLDDKRGIAVGDGTDRWPGGIYHTADGGASWQSLPAGRGGIWRSAAFAGPDAGVVAGSWGRLGVVRAGEFAPADIDDPRFRHVRAVALEDKLAVAVGQNGLVLVSADSAGSRYGFADLGLSADALASADFHGCCVRGKDIWIGGSPGTMVFHSGDAGKSWQAHTTGQSVPLNDIYFIDASHGWAAGELGTILSTTDGGKTWRAQRRGGQRAAILCIHGKNSSMPLDVIAHLAGDGGYLTTAVSVTCSDPVAAAPRRSADDLRLASAVRKCGGSSADGLTGFPIPPHLDGADRSELIKHWDALHSGHATDTLVSQIALAIRVWQPEVIITDFAGGSAESVIVEAIQAAAKQAADSTFAPEQIATWKLTPWTVKKVYGLWDGPGRPHVLVATGEYSTTLRETPRDFAGHVTGIIGGTALPKERGLRLLLNNLSTGGEGQVMDGINLAPGGTARRPAIQEFSDARDGTERDQRELRNLQSVAATGLPSGADPATVMARIGTVLEKMPAERAAISALGMAEEYARNGQWPLARETFAMIADKYAGQPAGLDAMRWLVRFHASSEARRRHELKQFISLSRTDFNATAEKENRYNPGSGVRPLAEGSTEHQLSIIADPAGARQWYQSAIALEGKLAAHGPLAAGDPAIQFALAAAKRQLGDPEPGKTWMRRFLAEQPGTGSDPWRDAARQELWLYERNGQPPRFAAACRKTDQRPNLDAQFDDACWANAVPITLKTAGGNVAEGYGTKARFAYDDEYLYVAIECQYPGGAYRPPVEKRTRDADLMPFDRVEFLLDLDRDYSTYYRFGIDQRGGLAEDCWGDSSWNPKWFVAFHSDENGYAAEAAIRLSDLTGENITPGRAWAINVVRIVPGKGTLAASTPADVIPRAEGCGVMVFMDTTKR